MKLKKEIIENKSDIVKVFSNTIKNTANNTAINKSEDFMERLLNKKLKKSFGTIIVKENNNKVDISFKDNKNKIYAIDFIDWGILLNSELLILNKINKVNALNQVLKHMTFEGIYEEDMFKIRKLLFEDLNLYKKTELDLLL